MAGRESLERMISLKSIDEKLNRALAKAKTDDDTVELATSDVKDLLHMLEIFRAYRGFVRVIKWVAPIAGFIVVAANNWHRIIDFFMKGLK